jgi:hypothetical protein
MAKASEYAVAKLVPPESNSLAYPFHDRANEVYGLWMSGYVEEEIAEFFSLEVVDVKKDLIYVNHKLAVRQIIQHNNDRQRIVLQREQSEAFRKMMKDSLGQSVQALLSAGISPAGILKEFREATGMVQKAEPLLQINTQINSDGSGTARGGGGNGGITSAEDVIRRVLNQINQEAPPSQDIEKDGKETVIDAEVVDPEGQSPSDADMDQIPDPDGD